MSTPRIPIYKAQVGTPQGRLATPSANSPGQYRMDLSGFDQFIANRRQANEENALNDARAQLSAEEPQAQLAFADAYSKIKTAWTPDAPPIHEQMWETIDQYRADAESRITHPAGREILASRMNEFKVRYGVEGHAYEQGARTDARVRTYEQSYKTAGEAGRSDPKTLGRSLATIKAAIDADTGIPEQAKAAFIEKQSNAVAMDVAQTQAESNSARVMQYTGHLLGIKEPVVTSGATGVDIVNEIFKRESFGGRMYGSGGEVLRGPAFKTRDGKTAHAYGPYQLIEPTAKSQAAKAGIEWDPELFHRKKTGDKALDDETRAYHDRLGQAYIRDQMAEFDGDPVLVAAAHNMGPAATRGWAAGVPYQTQSGDWWRPKHPKDMSAMPAETRKYVQGLGIEEKAVTVEADPLDPNDDEAIPYRMLTPDQLIQVRNQANANLAGQRREQADALKIQSDLFKQQLKDQEAAALNGTTIQVAPIEDFNAFLGPAEAIIARQKQLNYQQLGAELKTLPSLNSDTLDAIVRMPSPEGTEDRANRQMVHNARVERASKLLAARNSDPGKAAQDQSQPVSAAFSAWAAAANQYYEAGKQATPEAHAAMVKSQAAYVRTSFAQQRQWGVVKPMLPTMVVSKMEQGFFANLENNPEQAAQSMASLPELLGNDEAVSQVVDKIGPLGRLAVDGVPGLSLARIRAAQQIPQADQLKLIGNTTSGQIDQAVMSAFSPFFSTLAMQGGDDAATAANDYRKAANALVMDRVSRGESPKAAATAAYGELFADRNAVNGSYFVDTTRYEATKVDSGLSAILAAYPADGLLVEMEPGFTLEETQARKLRQVHREARWVNAGDDTVMLVHNNGPVLNRNGAPVQIKFDTAVKAAKPPSAPRSSYREAKGF